MKLYLVQHGLAVAKDVDPERPLSAQGEAEVDALAATLDAAGVQVTRVWHSGKRRAEQTAVRLAKKIARRVTVDTVTGLAPNDPVAEFAADADVWNEDTLVCGHLPFVSRLVSLLVLGDSERELVAYTPGTVVCLERRDTDWVIDWMLGTALLPAAREEETT